MCNYYSTSYLLPTFCSLSFEYIQKSRVDIFLAKWFDRSVSNILYSIFYMHTSCALDIIVILYV